MNVIYGYRKPSMTNIPRDIGEKIFDDIRNSTKPDRKRLYEEADKLEREIMKKREENNKRNHES